NIGQVEVGMLSAVIGAGPTMVIGGVLSVLFVAMVWRLLPGIRQYRYQTDYTAQERNNRRTVG
ncbi:MAG: hypothetical protein HYX90_09725, partial [Chloroflexi bacterium]|nr:hypothetical protein [Chloroflexota bacterium]